MTATGAIAPRVSFELFPPRSDAAAIALGRSIDRLADVDPAFFSVTFGAGGSSRDRSLTVLRYILEHTEVHPMAHLTCVGLSHAEANALVRQFLDAGVTSFLALRGDPPVGTDFESNAGIGDLKSAAELVQLIHRVQQERQQFDPDFGPGPTWARDPRLPDPRRPHGDDARLQIAVATAPTGHPQSRDLQQDVDALLAKQTAGAELAITQLFWRIEDYTNFVDLARAGGVTMPILPGIMPVTSAKRLARLTELTGVEPPAALVAGLDTSDEASAEEFGVAHATDLAERLIEADAPGLHLYTYNRHETVLEVLGRLGLTTSRTAASRATPERNTARP